MTTLFQIHGNMKNLKSLIKELAMMWQAGDKILLLAETAYYFDWLDEYIKDVNMDDESDYNIYDISGIYVLSEDMKNWTDSTKLNLNFTTIKPLTIKQLSDNQWVELTQQVDRVVTLNSSL